MTEKETPQNAPDHESFAVAVDAVVFTVQPPGRENHRSAFLTNPVRSSQRALHVALVRRTSEPFLGNWALPGGLVRRGEKLDDAVARALADTTGLLPEGDRYLEQLGSYRAPQRDPRQSVLSVAYFTVAHELRPVQGVSDAAGAEMWPVDRIDRRVLAFDHANTIDDGLERVRSLLEYTTFASRFLAPAFAASEIQEVYEAVWNVRLDSGNFRRNLEKCQGFVRVDSGGRPEHPPLPRGRGRPRSLWSTREPHSRHRSGTLLARALASRDRGTSMLGIRTRPAEPRLDFDYQPLAPDTYRVIPRDSDSLLGLVRKVREGDTDRWCAVSTEGKDLPGFFDARTDAAFHLWTLARHGTKESGG